MAVARGLGKEDGGTVVQRVQVVRGLLHNCCPAHLEVVKMVHFMFYIFDYSEKISLNIVKCYS